MASPSSSSTSFLGSLLASPEKLGLFIFILSISYYFTYIRPRKGAAPGPTPIPIFGNVLSVPTQKSWLYFNSLNEKYGPVVRLVLPQFREMIVLNKLEDIEELLSKRSGNYSSRNPLMLAAKYRSAGRRLALLPYGPLLTKQRAAVFQMLNARVVGGYEDIQVRGTEKLLFDLMEDSTQACLHIKWYTAQTLFSLVYGKRFSENGSELKTVLYILETFVKDMHPFTHLADGFPILDKLPDMLAPWRAKARKMHEFETEFYMRLLKEVKQRMDNGEVLECFAARLWESVEKNQLDDLSLAYIAGSAFEAGIDSMSGVVLWALVALLHYPEAMRKAQAELDRVLGAEGYTPPGFEHLPELPYCLALVKEALRWMPIAPTGAPHTSMKDDEYKGYTIPAGTAVVGNIWAVHHNEAAYPDSFRFNPERFLPKEGQVFGGELLNEGLSSFGFGRRVCPGQFLATKSVWVGITRLLWAFNISPPLDANNNPILPDRDACRSGLTSEPDSFDVVMTPRSSIHAQTIRSAWTKA